jgi:hypothetical protein
MDIKEECPIDIPTSHLAKMCLIPTENDLNMYSTLLRRKIKGHTAATVIITFLENSLESWKRICLFSVSLL